MATAASAILNLNVNRFQPTLMHTHTSHDLFVHIRHTLEITDDELANLGEGDKIDFGRRVLKVWGTTDLETLQKWPRLSVSQYQTLASTPDILQTRYYKGPLSTPPKGAPVILAKYPDAKFLYYWNEANGLQTSVQTLVNVSGKEYFVRTLHKSEAQQYLKDYERLREKQHRPEIIPIPCEDGSVITLSEFMGTEFFNFRDRNHLALAIALIPAFAEDRSVLCFDVRDLLFKDGKLFYVNRGIFTGAYP